jgi:hypothetical protein
VDSLPKTGERFLKLPLWVACNAMPPKTGWAVCIHKLAWCLIRDSVKNNIAIDA